MITRDYFKLKIGIIIVLFLSLFAMLISPSNLTPKTDIAFAADGDQEPVLVTASVEPYGAITDFVWTLTWDEENTGSIQYWSCKDKDPLEYISLDIDGPNCTVGFIQYYKILVKVTVYLTLTVTCTSNEEIYATCSIKLG